VRVGHVRRARIRGVVVAGRTNGDVAIGGVGTTFVVHTRRHRTGAGLRAGEMRSDSGATVVADVEITGAGLTDLDVRTVVPGDEAEISATLGADVSLTLVDATRNGHARQADDNPADSHD
jgi:hypothetical protein